MISIYQQGKSMYSMYLSRLTVSSNKSQFFCIIHQFQKHVAETCIWNSINVNSIQLAANMPHSVHETEPHSIENQMC